MNEEVTAEHWTVFKGAIHSHAGPGNDVLVVNIGGDPDDSMRRHDTRLFEIASGEELQDGVRPIYMAIDGILVGEHELGQRLTDDHHGFSVVGIARIKITARDDGNAQSGKVSRGDDTPVRAGILSAGGMGVTVP